MRFEFENLPLAVIFALALTGPTVPTQARAQTYQIDFAILLCLSGGSPTVTTRHCILQHVAEAVGNLAEGDKR